MDVAKLLKADLSSAPVPVTNTSGWEGKEVHQGVAIELEGDRWAVGDEVQGIVSITAAEPWDVREATVSLTQETVFYQDAEVDAATRTGPKWQHGFSDVAIAPLLAPGPLAAGKAATQRFSFRIPEEAMGNFVVPMMASAWSMRVRLDIKREADVEAIRPLDVDWEHVNPRLIDRMLVKPAPSSVGGATAGLSFVGLPEVAQPGEVISGAVLVEPTRNAVLKGGRIVLKMTAISGDSGMLAMAGSYQTKSVRTRVVEMPMQVPPSLAVGSPFQVPFSVQLPDPVPAPSIEHEHFRVRWELEAALSAKGFMKLDPLASHPVIVGTGWRRTGAG